MKNRRRFLGLGLQAASAWAVVSAHAQSDNDPERPSRVSPSRTYDVTAFGADPSGMKDSRSAIQSAITAAESGGGGRVFVPEGTYRVVVPQRTTDPRNFHAYDGLGLVISASNVTLEGRGRQASRLQFRSAGDRPMGTAWQLVNNSVWRGPGIFICGGSSADTIVQNIAVRGLSIDGGAGYTGNVKFPADPGTGDGWDLTHKGIMVEPDRYVGTVETSNCEVANFRGELLYQGGPHGGTWLVHSNELHSTNGDCFSSSMHNEVRDNLMYHAAFDGIECGYFGGGSNYRNNTIRDCDGEGISLVMEGAAPGRQTVAGNRLENCKKGIICKSPQNVLITGNTLVDCGGAAGSGFRAMQFYDDGTHPVAGLVVSENTISAGQMARDAAIAMLWSANLAPGGVRIENNQIDPGAIAAGGGTYRVPILMPRLLGAGSVIRGNQVAGRPYQVNGRQ